MEKINELFANFEAALRKVISNEALESYTQTTGALKDAMGVALEKKKQLVVKSKGKGAGVTVEEYVKSTDAEISALAERFAKVIDLTKQLETDAAIKAFLAEKIGTIFDSIAEGAARTFNLSTLEIFDDMMGDLRGDMEEKLIAGIEEELFRVKTSFGDFEKVYEIMEQQFAGINDAMNSMKDHYRDQMTLLKMSNDIIVNDLPKITEIFLDLSQKFDALQSEGEKIRNNSQENTVNLLHDLRAEVEARNTDLTTQLKNKETELKEVSQFLEKSPKYQILYIINNLEECNMEKLKGLTNIDESIISLALADLKEKDLITLTGEAETLSIKIKQKLNPLSYLELPAVFDGESVTKFKNYIDVSSFEEGFNQILAQINEYRNQYREATGYLLSVLYLYIYESKYFQFYDKIHKLFQEFRNESFYIKLVVNALHNNPWESKKTAEVEGMGEASELTILSKSLDTIQETSEDYPKAGPFVIEAYKPLSLLVRSDEVKMAKTQLNYFTSLTDLLKWVWLNGKGTSFLVKYQDAAGKKSEVFVSATPQIDAQLLVKKIDVRVD